MKPYQIQYVNNAREIAALSDFYGVSTVDFAHWYETHRQADERIDALKKENIDLLNSFLFPALDDLHNATADDISHLEQFAAELMDWTTNLDCGVYILIHDSLLSLYRVRRDRNGVIRELYKLGMGLYYQNRMVQGVEDQFTSTLYFQNEMVFTEAGSYLKFFPEIQDTETKGYIIRALANISICSKDLKRRIAVSSRVLKIVQDPYYRDLAPELPWDVFLRRTYQQMSSNRHVLSRGNLSSEELAAVLEACQQVFKPESATAEPNVRWLWPYYEMEYSCGFVDLATTLERMERLIEGASFDQYDVSGLYANVQLPIYYGRLMKENPALQTKKKHVHFLDAAYRKMMRTLMSFPADQMNDFFQYNVILVLTDYFEMDGVESYREITTRLMQRLCGRLYIRSRQTGDILRRMCGTILDGDPGFFDDIPFLREISDPDQHRDALLRYAGECGLYHDFGMIKMNLERLCQTRDLFESEYQIMKLHTVSGHDDLRARDSTRIYADVAFGHHSWYSGSGGYPDDYVRNRSPYRQMTDTVAVAAYMTENFRGDADELFDQILAQEGRRFSPLVTACLMDPALKEDLKKILRSSGKEHYQTMFRQLTELAAKEKL